MAADKTLARSGLYFDELNKIRVLEPEVAQQTTELRDECRGFVDKINDFHELADHFMGVADRLRDAVEKEKLSALGARNMLKSISKQREAQQLQLQALIGEKKLELERLRIQHDSLQQTEAEQQEFIEQFITQK
ncbi:intraflagellar transport protein 20 homolog [Hyalella azteca]|uniref:Intraflagellar transport protein 20 homolog n=1 Tax=Hyalella azteca TaxID=294128 RepID=A0A8B7PKW6_HYAAZ|nr:intraflagellar transport protein 20 homolog [Hyalella azteca]